MTNDLLIRLGLVLFALAFASALLVVNLGSQGVPRTRIIRVLAEFWGAIAGLIAAYLLLFGLTPTAQTGLGSELVVQLARWRALGFGTQILVILALLISIGLFVHMLVSLRGLQSTTREDAHMGGNE